MKQNKMLKQSGFSLMEVLIAVLVLGIGLLGVAGLQNTTVRSMQGSYERSQAIILLDMLAERLRADSENARIGNYDMACDNEALETWNNLVREALNNPEACVDITYNGALQEYTLTLNWADERFSVGQNSTMSLRVSP